MTFARLFLLSLFAIGCGEKDPPPDTGEAIVDTQEEAVDADGDGFVEGDDCDDSDPDVFPGAEELCNDLDDDCDGTVDQGATDAETLYTDADGDGFGDPEAPVTSCSSEGLVQDDTDCDDSSDDTHREADEVGCDGRDNDCDGTIDLNRVPSDHGTLMDAVDALPDGSEVCVEPGTYAEVLDLGDRSLRFTGQLGPGSTALDLGSSHPMVTVGGGAVAFSGFTVTGDLDGTEAPVEGGFVRLEGGSLELSNVEMSAVSASTAADGVLVWALDAALSLNQVRVDGVEIVWRCWAWTVRGGAWSQGPPCTPTAWCCRARVSSSATAGWILTCTERASTSGMLYLLESDGQLDGVRVAETSVGSPMS